MSNLNEEKRHKNRGLILANQMDRSEDSSKLTVKSMVAFQAYEVEYLKLIGNFICIVIHNLNYIIDQKNWNISIKWLLQAYRLKWVLFLQFST